MSAERIERLKKVAVEIDLIMKEIAPKLVKLSHLRAEAKTIIEEYDATEGR